MYRVYTVYIFNIYKPIYICIHVYVCIYESIYIYDVLVALAHLVPEGGGRYTYTHAHIYT